MNPGSGRNSTTFWMLIQSIYILLANLASTLQDTATWPVLSLNLQKAIPPLYQTSCFRTVKSVVRPEKSRAMSPLLRFCCEVRSWDFHGSAVAKTPHFHCQGCRFNPWSGNQDPTCCIVCPKQKRKKEKRCMNDE